MYTSWNEAVFAGISFPKGVFGMVRKAMRVIECGGIAIELGEAVSRSKDPRLIGEGRPRCESSWSKSRADRRLVTLCASAPSVYSR